jgi:D-glycero-alpha-D-manno-heptose 1-phosphate guanylyltransferase
LRSLSELRFATALVLAGGLGTRLSSVVADRPKVLAPVAGRPFLSYLLDQLRAAGIRRAVLCTGHLGDQIEAAFGSSYRDVALEYSREPDPAGTGGALARAAALVSESSPVLILNGDSYCDVDLEELWHWHHSRFAHATLVAVAVPDASRFGRLELDAHGRIVGFHEKSAQPSAGLVNGGIYLVRTEALAGIADGRPVSLEREVFPAWTKSGLYGFPTSGRFIDIGTPESFRDAESFVRELTPEAA